MHKMGGTNDGLLRDSDTEAVGPSSNRNIPEGGNVKSEIDDYIESLWVSVVTRWQDTNGLLAGSRIRKVSEEELTTFSKSQPMGGRVLERPNSVTTNALKGLKFISKVEGMTWVTLEKQFNDLTMDTDGLLPRSRFWECIGMNKDSQEFGGELFDALSRRRNLKGDSINKEEMKDFWDQISDQSFDSRLQTFFEMIDKDGDGRITEEEVREIIIVSASANNLPKVKNQADEYAALIMEELDPDNLGYIMIEDLEMLLLQAPHLNVEGESRMLSEKLETVQIGNPIKRRWYENLRFPKVFINSSNGVPAQDYNKYGAMLLVGSGIEATPIINIVKDILNNIEAKEKEEENGKTGTSKLHKKKPGPTRAYFYWVTKNRGSFYTVKEVMNEAAEMDKNGVMEMHIYCTNESKEDDARTALISMLESINAAKNGVDVVSETRVKSHFAKPNWFEVYMHIALTHSGSRIGVIYCGEPAPGKELKQLAHEFSHKTSTKFEFHKENL